MIRGNGLDTSPREITLTWKYLPHFSLAYSESKKLLSVSLSGNNFLTLWVQTPPNSPPHPTPPPPPPPFFKIFLQLENKLSVLKICLPLQNYKQFQLYLFILWGMNTTGRRFAISTKGDNFWDFPFVLLHAKPLLWRVFFIRNHLLPLAVDPIFRSGQNPFWQLSPLKVYSFALYIL